MYKFTFNNCSIYYKNNIVGTYQKLDNCYLIIYYNMNNEIVRFKAKTKKELRNELKTNCKRYI